MKKLKAGVSLGSVVRGPAEFEAAPGKPEADPETVPTQPAAPPPPPRAEPPPAAAVLSPDNLPRSNLERDLGIVPFTFFVSPNDRERLTILATRMRVSKQKLAQKIFSDFLESIGQEPLDAVKASVPDGRRKRKAGE